MLLLSNNPSFCKPILGFSAYSTCRRPSLLNPLEASHSPTNMPPASIPVCDKVQWRLDSGQQDSTGSNVKVPSQLQLDSGQQDPPGSIVKVPSQPQLDSGQPGSTGSNVEVSDQSQPPTSAKSQIAPKQGTLLSYFKKK